MRVLQCFWRGARGVQDASAQFVSEIFNDYGIPSTIVNEEAEDWLQLLLNFNAKPDDLFIVHHSFEAALPPIMKVLFKGLSCRKMVIYHGDERGHQMPVGSATRHDLAVRLADLDQLAGADVAIGTTRWACEILRRRGFSVPHQLPLVGDVLTAPHRRYNETFHYFKTPRYQLVSVGPLSPAHRQLQLVEFVRRYADAFPHPLYLAVVGQLDADSPYTHRVRQMIVDARLEDRITLADGGAEYDRFGYYRAADVFISLSEDETFNVPALEAMAFDLPVLTRAETETADLLAGAGVLLADDEPQTLARELVPLFADRSQVRSILKQQRQRLATFSRQAIGVRLIELLRPLMAQPVIEPAQVAPAHHRQYFMEGPCETSYSLAITNRTLALALAQNAENSVTLVPGGEGFTFNEAGLRTNPEIVPLLKPPPFKADTCVISYRHNYPMYAAGLRGDFRLSGISLEESETSQAQARMFNRYLDGLLTGSTFVRKLFRDSGVRLPIALYPHGLDHLRLPPPAAARTADRPFMFLHVSSGLARKGIEELFAAYAIAFSRSDRVELLIKTIYKHETSVLEKYYAKWVEGREDAPIVRIIFDDRLDRSEIARLYSLADAVVLPTRGEGFGYPAAEGHFYGVPVIVTAWSGQMDFCNPENSYLVDYDFELSTSHVRSGGAMWVRANVEDLAEKMRHLFVAKRTAGGRAEMNAKIESGRKSAAQLTFKNMADQVDAFADHLENGTVERRKLKIGWVTTWNKKCGVATHSEQMVPYVPADQFDVVIISSREDTLRPDEPNVRRCWPHHHESLDPIVNIAIEEKCDIVLFQYHFAYHAVKRLGEAIDKLEAAGIDTYIEIHKTAPELAHGEEVSFATIAGSLAKAARIIVHTVDDVNRLKAIGLVENVVKIPPGVIAPINVSQAAIKEFLGLGKRGPVIGSYGFLFPHKGIKTLIFAFALVARKYPDAVLLLANAINNEESQREKNACIQLIESFGLQSSVIMINDFLDHQESMLLNQACDLLVFAYQFTAESASGAVRPGIASLRPVITTPSSIFDEVADLVVQAKGSSALDVAEAIESLLSNMKLRGELFEAQKAWVDSRSWEATTVRITNMMLGLYQDRRNVVLQRPAVTIPAAEPVPAHDISKKRGGVSTFVRTAYSRAFGYTKGDTLSHSAKLGETLENLRSADTYRLRRPVPGGSSTTYLFSDLDTGDDFTFVSRIYEIVHNRSGEPDGIAGKVAYLASGGSRADLVRFMLESDEFIHANLPICIIFDGPSDSSQARVS